MKRTFTLILSLCLLFSSYIPANAKTPDTLTTTSTYTEYINDELYMEVTLSVSENATDSVHNFFKSTASTQSSTKQRTASKVCNIKNYSGSTVATYTLTGTFRYNGSSASCTNASCSTSISDSSFSFSNKSATRSGNKAVGSYTLTRSFPPYSASGTPTLTCSVNGNIQ